MRITGKHIQTGQPTTFHIHDGKIAQSEEVAERSNLPWISPGFVDLQVNGYGGQEFNDEQLSVEHVAQISRQMDRDGVIAYCPTCTTHRRDVLAHALNTIAEAIESESDVARRVLGIHLEGPYISQEDGPRGAHPLAHCRPPDLDEFKYLQEQARGRIKILTMSPEFAGAAEFIQSVSQMGVLVAIGHTAATSDQIRAAVDAGARLSTHLGNGAHGMIRRHPNYIWDQLADDRLTASLIADGHHLPENVVKSFVRAKTAQRCVLVSDITGMAGMPPGRYETTTLGAVEVLPDGRLVVAGQRQYLAGAALPIGVGIANIVEFAGVELAEAVAMASSRPRRLVGEPECGLDVGNVASLVQFEMLCDPTALKVTATMNHGDVVFGAFVEEEG